MVESRTRADTWKMTPFLDALRLLYDYAVPGHKIFSGKNAGYALLYFDLFIILSNLDFLVVQKYRSKYSFGRSKVLVEVKFWSK